MSVADTTLAQLTEQLMPDEVMFLAVTADGVAARFITGDGRPLRHYTPVIPTLIRAVGNIRSNRKDPKSD